VIAKILRPKKRKQEMRFSQCAVIGPVDDEDQRPALMIRLADIQHKLYIAESHVRLYMATTKINNVGKKYFFWITIIHLLSPKTLKF